MVASENKKKPVEDLSYSDALEELEKILHELEVTTSVDLLTDQVRRGKKLLSHCKKRLAFVSEEVTETVAMLEESD